MAPLLAGHLARGRRRRRRAGAGRVQAAELEGACLADGAGALEVLRRELEGTEQQAHSIAPYCALLHLVALHNMRESFSYPEVGVVVQ